VYRIYGLYDCLNVVTEPEGHGSAVLLRALEPVANVAERTQGPGLLCRAMGVDRSFNGRDLLHPDFCIVQAQDPPPAVVRRPRVGVDYAGPRWAGRLLRFHIRGHPFISRP
jgi:DNA-3-methyladenine glycosylase